MACGASAEREPGDGNDERQDATSDDGVQRAWLPEAPTAGTFALQGAQDRLVATGDTAPAPPCANANVTVAMWSNATCYAGAGGQMMCAGAIGTKSFGPEFVSAGIDGVVQMMGTPNIGVPSTTGGPDGVAASVCVAKEDGTAWCLGTGKDRGQFRTADGEQPGNTWKQWGTRDDIVELASDQNEVVCARYADGTADCVGWVCHYPYELSPCTAYYDPLDLGDGVRSLWVDGYGRPRVNDPAVFRAGNSVSDCVVVADGLSCDGGPAQVLMAAENAGRVRGPLGIVITTPEHAGHVVDGNSASQESACWLTDSGATWCSEAPEPGYDDPDGDLEEVVTQRYFEGITAIALAVNGYSNGRDRCVVASDGALWCIGVNEGGKFGTGSPEPLTVATEVQPAGSVRIECGGGA